MKCSFCAKPAVIFRKYEGTHLCRDCFCKSVEAKVKRNIRKYGMVKSGDKIALALSGGKDSSTVLYIIKNLFRKWRGMDIFAISIDEGIKGYRPSTLLYAKKLCRRLGVKHHVFSFKKEFGRTLDEQMGIVRKKKPDIKEPCTYCGVSRRNLLNRAARRLGATKLCVGHNLDDEVQAILLNFLRGDLPRASRMSALLEPGETTGKGLFIPRIKPLRELPEKEIALYAMLKGIYQKRAECPYAGGIRFEARDFLNHMEAKYPGIKFSFLFSFDKIKPWIEEGIGTGSGVVECSKCGEPGSGGLCRACELLGK